MTQSIPENPIILSVALFLQNLQQYFKRNAVQSCYVWDVWGENWTLMKDIKEATLWRMINGRYVARGFHPAATRITCTHMPRPQTQARVRLLAGQINPCQKNIYSFFALIKYAITSINGREMLWGYIVTTVKWITPMMSSIDHISSASLKTIWTQCYTMTTFRTTYRRHWTKTTVLYESEHDNRAII